MPKLRPKQTYIDLGYRFVITANNWKVFYGERELGSDVTPMMGEHWIRQRKQYQINAAAAMTCAATHLDALEDQISLDRFAMSVMGGKACPDNHAAQ